MAEKCIPQSFSFVAFFTGNRQASRYNAPCVRTEEGALGEDRLHRRWKSRVLAGKACRSTWCKYFRLQQPLCQIRRRRSRICGWRIIRNTGSPREGERHRLHHRSRRPDCARLERDYAIGTCRQTRPRRQNHLQRLLSKTNHQNRLNNQTRQLCKASAKLSRFWLVF